jgi:hypothetical protein
MSKLINVTIKIPNMNKNYVLPLLIFNKLKYNDLINIQGVSKRTANFLEDMIETTTVNSYVDIQKYVIKHNKLTNNKIRHNFIKNDIVKMRNGYAYQILYI